MEWLKEWIMTICGGAVFCAVINLLVPDERYEKIIKMCTAAFILLLIAAPLTNINSCTDTYIANEKVCDYSDFERSVENQAMDYMTLAAERIIAQRLEENGISNVKISVLMDSSESGCISIGHVTLETEGTHQTDETAVKAMLKEWFNLSDVEVKYNGLS